MTDEKALRGAQDEAGEAVARPDPGGAGRTMEALGDADGDADFAAEHERTVVDDDPGAGETESPDRWAGGLDREGPP
ncbi:hypothetical protein [Actinoplanes sp. NPDC026623]|uniref:hypothetical protein n=1 Tax=Actinoplanes sp. NPDC026623 TaxID=3155610 RepID=UPI0034075DA8